MPDQTIEVPLGKLDTLTAPESLAFGDFTTLNNVHSQVPLGYSKRNGWTALSAGPSGIMRLAGLGATLLALTGTNCYAYNSALGSWATGGPVSGAQSSQTNIYLDQSADVRGGTRATAGGITAHAWINNTGGAVYLQLRSVADDAIISHAVIDSTANFKTVHAVVAGQYILVVYMSHGSQLIRYVRVDSATGTVTTAATLLSGANVYNTASAFDVYPYSSTDVYIAWTTNTPSVKVMRYNVATLAVTITSAAIVETPNSGLAVMGTIGEGLYVAYVTAAGNVRVSLLDPTSTILSAGPTTVTTCAAGTDRNIGLCRYDSTDALLVYSHSNGATTESTEWGIVTNTLTCSPSVIRNVRLVSKPYAYSGSYYCNVWVPYALQYTHVTVRIAVGGVSQTAIPVAVHAYRAADYNPAPLALLSDVDQESTGVFAFDSTVAYKFLSTATTREGLASFSTDFVSNTRSLPIEAGGDAMFSGGVVDRFDGSKTTEVNYIAYPQILSATPGAVGAAGMDDGIYSYIVIFESGNANGNVDRSTTSTAVSATTAAGAGLGKVVLIVDHLSLTNIGWTTAHQQGTASIFRTLKNASTYRYIGQVAMDPTTANFTYTDQANDSTITSNRLLYTTGGALDREPPLPSKQLLLHRNHVWGISSADPNVLFYSGDITLGEGVWFSSAQQIRVEGEPMVAIASLDDKLVIRTANRTSFIVGDPGNQLGQNSTLQAPQLIMADTGGSDPFHVSCPNGLLFRSAKGYQLLDRSLNLQYLGEPDLYYSSYPITRGATMVADKHEARFELDDGSEFGIKLVYNYRDNRWTTFSNISDVRATSAVVVGGTYYYANLAGATYYEDTTTHVDAGATFVAIQAITGWMRFGARQGFSRLRRLLIMGTYYSAHDINWLLAGPYYSNGTSQGSTFTNAQIIASITYPSEQLPIHVRYQKGEAWRLVISDSLGSGDTLGAGQGFTLHGFTALAEMKRGTFEKQMTTAVKG